MGEGVRTVLERAGDVDNDDLHLIIVDGHKIGTVGHPVDNIRLFPVRDEGGRDGLVEAAGETVVAAADEGVAAGAVTEDVGEGLAGGGGAEAVGVVEVMRAVAD